MIIFYNGATGGLGKYFAEVAHSLNKTPISLQARLEDRKTLLNELNASRIWQNQNAVSLVQMASMVSVPQCEADPKLAFQTNVTHVIESVRGFVQWAQDHHLKPSVCYVSTGHVYASQNWGDKLSETSPTSPRSVYAQSKLAAESELSTLQDQMHFDLVIGRVFGLVSPTQPPHYVLPGLVKRARESRFEGIPGLDFARDYLDARDVCRLLIRALQSPMRIVNICSGEPVRIRDLMNIILDRVWPTQAAKLKERLSVGPGRPDDVPWIVGNPLLIKSILGDDPIQTVPLSQTVDELLAITQ